MTFKMPNALPMGSAVQDTSVSVIANEKDQKPNPALLYVLTLGSDQSRRRVLASLNKIATEFGYPDAASCEWERMRFSDINTLKSRWQKANKAPATINLAVALLRGVAKQAWLANLISDKDYMAITMTKGARGSRLSHGRALNPSESHLVIQSCREEDTRIGKRDAAIFALGLGCGLRRNELGTLRLKDVDRSEHSLRILGKGNKERMAFCPPPVWEIFTEWLDCRGDDGEYVFCHVRKGDKLDPHSELSNIAIYQMMVRRAEKLHVDLAPHDLRRTFATRLFEMGGDANLVRKAMGHSSVATTQRYDKRDDKAVQNLVSGLRL